ncbi:hypothetical protein J4440_01440 [Candidatus Woesearchaeota archaeon]|nr:hypothetical protein [Candidatus Woesearchaeota archaeon]
MSKLKINFDELKGIEDSLEVFLTISEHVNQVKLIYRLDIFREQCINPDSPIVQKYGADFIYESKQARPNQILRNPTYPNLGFRARILPFPISNISYYTKSPQFVISFDSRLKNDPHSFKEQNYNVREVKKSLDILDESGDLIAVYGLSRILIPEYRTQDFVRLLKEIPIMLNS